MIRRFRLEQKSLYEKLVIAQRLSDMLDKFLSGRPAPLLIGAEQGGISEWDDVVIHHVEGYYEHLQIKRQSTPFCEKNIDKDVYVKSYKPRKINNLAKPKAPPASENDPDTSDSTGIQTNDQFDSELDKAFKSLAAWQLSDDVNKLPKRIFTLTLPGLDIAIKGSGKNIIKVNHLHEFCNICRIDGTVLSALSEREDNPTQRVYQWLTTWCGFEGWEHVKQTMRLLTVDCIGDEVTLQKRAHESLGRHFIDPQQTLDLLIAYISENTTDVSVIGCYDVARHLHSKLRPGVETWTQYLDNRSLDQTWSVAGTHNLATSSVSQGVHSHAASEIVKHHWGITAHNRKLRLHAKYTPSTPKVVALPSAILRLALHLKSGSHCLLLDESVWRNGAENEVGRTLGISDRDLDDLPWIDNRDKLVCCQGRNLSTAIATREEATALHSAMNELVWEQLQRSVSDKVESITDSALMAAMDFKWRAWMAELTTDQNARQLLFEQLMYPHTEGIDPTQALRIGPRTIELLETSILMLLLVCVAIGGKDANWRSIPQIGDVISIALRNWSGAATGTRSVRPLYEDALMSLLGPSPAPVVILAGVDASPTSLLEAGMADDFESSHSMAAERQPHLLVTRFGVMKYLRTGTLATLERQFERYWSDWRIAREAAIDANGKGSNN